MPRYLRQTSGVLEIVIQDLHGEDHVDLHYSFDGNVLARVTSDGDLLLMRDMKSNQKERFGVSE